METTQQLPELTPEQQLKEWVCGGLVKRLRYTHWLQFRTAIKICSEDFINDRMNATSDQEELEARLKFADRVVEEYLHRALNREERKSSVRSMRSTAEIQNTCGYLTLRDNWMNPENLAKANSTPKVQREAMPA